jgi:pentose-5-phosphate-3-epimerase
MVSNPEQVPLYYSLSNTEHYLSSGFRTLPRRVLRHLISILKQHVAMLCHYILKLFTDDPAALIQYIRSAKMDVGMAIKPGTSVESVQHLLPLLDYVLVMTVEPGFGGQSLILSCIEFSHYM